MTVDCTIVVSDSWKYTSRKAIVRHIFSMGTIVELNRLQLNVRSQHAISGFSSGKDGKPDSWFVFDSYKRK